MPDPKLFESVCRQARQAMLLQTAADTLEWDERTGMPAQAADYRADQVATLRATVHRTRTDPAYGDLLQQLVEQLPGEDPHTDVNATIRQLHHDWDRDRKLPTALVQRIAAETVRGQGRWDEARRAADFSRFRDALATMIELKREAGQRLSGGSESSPYEMLVDEFEPGASVADLERAFAELRGPLVKLIDRVQAAEKLPRFEIVEREFDVNQQRKFSRRIAEAIGFDFSRGRLDETTHPFCTTLGPHDCRILTRFDPNWLPSGVFGTMHEAGHGMYEQGLRSDWFGLPPGSFTSLGIHESQSRLWENQVGRNRSFWQWLYPEAQRAFAPTLDDVALDDFHFAINTVRPSLVRVEADEATYNLHIIIRFELERRLIDGSLAVDDLPDAWNGQYESDLGVKPTSDADGVLQDVHWSAGLFGYFPTYTLGNLAAAQLYDAAGAALGDLDAMFARGEFGPLLGWLREHVHRYGRCYGAGELVELATGQPLGANSLVRSLEAKFGLLYGIG